MTSTGFAPVLRLGKQIVAVIGVSYLGAIFGLGLYESFEMCGFHFQEIAGDMSRFYFVGGISVPIASVLACVLVSWYAENVRPSKLGILLSLVVGCFGVYSAIVLVDATSWDYMLLWPAIVGFYSFCGYQAGLIVVRRWRSSRRPGKEGGQLGQ